MKTIAFLLFKQFSNAEYNVSRISAALALLGVFTGCAPGIDFSQHGENDLNGGGNAGTYRYPDGTRMRMLDCGQSATFSLSGVDGMMGILTLHSNRNQASPAAPHCTLVVKTILKQGEQPALPHGDTITRTVLPGESMTEVMKLGNADNIVVIVKCVGDANPCIFSEPKFQSGKSARNPRERLDTIKSNSLAARVYQPTGQNKCETNETVLHRLYLDKYDPTKVALEMVAVSHCSCPNFQVRISGRREVSIDPHRGEGNVIPIRSFRAGENVVEFTGKCTGMANSDCAGGVELRIAGKPL